MVSVIANTTLTQLNMGTQIVLSSVQSVAEQEASIKVKQYLPEAGKL